MKKMHQRRGVQAEAGAEGQARQSRAERAAAPTHPASPMGLRKCIGGEEVAATFGSLEIRLGASFFVSLGAGDILSTTCDDYLLACP